MSSPFFSDVKATCHRFANAVEQKYEEVKQFCNNHQSESEAAEKVASVALPVLFILTNPILSLLAIGLGFAASRIMPQKMADLSFKMTVLWNCLSQDERIFARLAAVAVALSSWTFAVIASGFLLGTKAEKLYNFVTEKAKESADSLSAAAKFMAAVDALKKNSI